MQMYPFVMDLKYTDPSLIVKKEHVYWNAQQIVTNKTNFCTAPLAQLLCDYIEEHNTLGITNLLTNKFAPQFVNLNAKKGALFLLSSRIRALSLICQDWLRYTRRQRRASLTSSFSC